MEPNNNLNTISSLSYKQQVIGKIYCISNDNIHLRTTEGCVCGLTYQEYWTRNVKKCPRCLKENELERIKAEQALKIKQLEADFKKSQDELREELSIKQEYIDANDNLNKSISEKKNQIKSLRTKNLENFTALEEKNIENSELKKNLSEKDLIIENLNKKLKELEIKSENNETIESEIIEEKSIIDSSEIDNKSENSDGFTTFD